MVGSPIEVGVDGSKDWRAHEIGFSGEKFCVSTRLERM